MKKPFSKKKIILVSAFVLLLIILATSVFFISKNSTNKYGDQLEISNLSQYTNETSKSRDSLEYIKYDLLRTVNKNVDTPVQGNSVKDILIRDGTFKESKDEGTGVYTVTFTVDIESLKQSYGVTYEWSESGVKDNMDEWGTMVKCLPLDQLKYGDFKCKDMFSVFNEDPEDPILNFLPQTTIDYKVTYEPSKDKTLNVTIYTSAADERINPDAAIEKYKSDVKDWISSTGLDPKDYTVNYTVIRASLY